MLWDGLTIPTRSSGSDVAQHCSRLRFDLCTATPNLRRCACLSFSWLELRIQGGMVTPFAPISDVVFRGHYALRWLVIYYCVVAQVSEFILLD